MTRKTVIYVLLIASILGSCFFSFYYYVKANRLQNEMEEATSKTSALPDYHMVLIGEEMDNDYWRLVGEGAKEAGADYDVFVDYKGPRRSNLDEQMKLLDLAIAAKVDGIIVQALNDKFKPMINKAVQAGIPVVTIDTDAKDSLRSSYVGTDNYEAGKMAGKALIEETNGKAEVAIVTGSFNSFHHQLRVKGFKDIVEKVDGVHIVTVEESNITRVGAEEKADFILKEYPQVDAFFGVSALDGMGISSAVRSIGKEKDIYIIAFDALEETIDLLQEGDIDTVVAQEPYKIGYESVEKMLAIIEGKSVKELNYTHTKIITPRNLEDLDIHIGGYHD